MARVESKEVIVPDVYASTRESAESAEKAVKKLSDELQRQLDLQAQLAKNVKKGAKGLQEMNKLEGKSKKILSEKEKLDKKILKQRQLLTKVDKQSIAASKSLSVEQQRRNKLATQTAKLQNKNIGAFERLNIKIKQQSDAYRNLIVQEGKETAESRKLQKNILKLNKIRDKANESIGIHSAKVGKYKNALKGLTGTLAKLGIGFGVFQILKDSFNTLKNFEQSIANLSAITGATGDDLDFLKNKAIELGKSTTLSASQVAEGFKIIASAKPELLEDAEALALVTEQSILLAEAAGIELPEAAAAVTNSLNQFGAGADQTSKFVDVLAAGAKFGAGDINFLNEALVKAGTVASNANFEFSETAAALELLAEKGVPASVAGTNLKGVILRLQQAGKGFTSGQFDFNDALAETNAMLDGISDPAERAAKEIKLFGSENLAAGQTFLNGSDRLAELNRNLSETGVAAEQAKTNNDTLEGSLKLLASAWEGYVLGAGEAGGITDKLKNIVKFLANNLETILSTIFNVVKAFVTYKVVTFAVTKAMKLYNTVQTLATKGMKNFTKATKLNPFGAIAAALVIILPLLWDFVDGIVNAKDASNLLSRVTDEVTERLAKEKEQLTLLGIELNATNAGSEERLVIINKINSAYGTTLENLEDETAFLEQLAIAYKSVVDEMEKKFRAEVNKEFLKDLIRQETELLLEIDRLNKEAGDKNIFATLLSADIVDLASSTDKLADVREQIELLKGVVGEDLVAEEVDKTTESVDNLGGSAKKAAGEVKELKRQLIDAKKTDPNAGILDEDKGADFAGALRNIKQNTREVELEMRKRGTAEADIQEVLNDRKLSDLMLQRDAAREIFGENSQEFLDLDLKVRQEVAKRDKRDQDDADKRRAKDLEADELAEKKRQELIAETWKKIRDNVSETLQFIEKFYERNIELINKQQEAQQGVFDDSKERESELKEIAKERGLNADESINAEREKQKAALAEQQDLERKKQRVAALIAALQLLSSKVESGEGNPVQNIKSQISNLKSFIDGEFYEGTEYTVADALGATGTRDGHIVRIDDNESVLTGDQTRAMNIGKGGNSTNDIVDIYKQSLQRKMNPRDLIKQPNQMADSIVANKLDKIDKSINNTKDMGAPVFDAMVGALTYKKKGTKYVYPVRKR